MASVRLGLFPHLSQWWHELTLEEKFWPEKEEDFAKMLGTAFQSWAISLVIVLVELCIPSLH